MADIIRMGTTILTIKNTGQNIMNMMIDAKKNLNILIDSTVLKDGIVEILGRNDQLRSGKGRAYTSRGHGSGFYSELIFVDSKVLKWAHSRLRNYFSNAAYRQKSPDRKPHAWPGEV